MIPLLAAFTALVWWARRHLVVVTVEGTSMHPAFTDGDRLLVRRGRVRRTGQIAVFRNPVAARPPWLVKRVAALPGEPVPRDFAATVHEPVCPPGTLLVRGDAARTQDSRHFGGVVASSVLGPVVCRLP